MPRNDTAAFKSANNAPVKRPLYVVEVAFDLAKTDLHYFTTNDLTEVPPTAVNIYPDTIKGITGKAQSLNPLKAISSIGGATVSLVNLNSVITDLIKTKLDSGDGLRRKTVTYYVGYEGLAWSDYAKIFTQIIEEVSYPYGGVIIQTEDIKRTVKEDIFDLETTNLYETIDALQTAIRTTSPIEIIDFLTVAHGPSFASDAPNLEVGYFKVNEEIVRWADQLAVPISNTGTDISFSGNTITKTGADLGAYADGMEFTVSGSAANSGRLTINGTPTASTIVVNETLVTETAGPAVTLVAETQFYNCVRGRLGSRAAIHEVDITIPVTASDKKPLVEEYVYLELPLPKLDYAIKTGILYDQGGKTLPPGWQLDISTDFISTSHYVAIGNDLWDTTDDTQGEMIFRFTGEKRQNAKQFIAEQLMFPMSCFDPVLNDGQLAIKRMANVLTDSPYVAVLDETNTVDFGTPREAMKDLANRFHVFWNRDDQEGRFTRDHPFIDAVSIAKHQAGKVLIKMLRGLHGSRHTVSTIRRIFDSLRDRYSGPPIMRNVTCFHKMNTLEVGEIVRLVDPNTPDPSSVLGTTDRSYEIQSKNVNWSSGRVSFGLFGSAHKASPWAPIVATALNDTFYSTGLLAANKLDNDASTGLTTSLISNVLHITGGATLTGNADVTANAAIYWYDTWPVVIDAGVTINWTDNVQFRVKDSLTNNGTMASIGGGLPGITAAETAGTVGGVGVTQAGGGLTFKGSLFASIVGPLEDRPMDLAEGTTPGAIPYMTLTHDGDTISGFITTDFRGTSGGSGGDIVQEWDSAVLASGGAGGAGGGGILIVTRTYIGGGSAKIDTSGVAGAPGANYFGGGRSLYTGTGGAGAPGGIVIILDGATAIAAGGDIIAIRPGVAMLGNIVFDGAQPWSSPSRGLPELDSSQSMYRLQWLQENVSVVEDTPSTTGAGTGLSFVPNNNVPDELSGDRVTIDVSVTGARDSNYKYDNIYAKKSTDTDYQLQGTSEVGVEVTMDGSTYDFRAYPVSIDGIESTDFVQDSYTVVNQKGGANLATGNYMALGQTSYDNGVGAWIQKIASGVQASFGNSAGDKLLIDTDAASVVEIIGKATIDEGSIGGWSITATYISIGSGATHMQFNPTTGIWFGADLFANAPFSVSPAGAVKAESGTIGGATISATQLYNGTNVILDWSSNYIAINSAAFGNVGIQFQYNAGSPQLYVGDGSTKYLKYTGAGGVEVGLGTLKETIYEVYTSGLMRSNASPSTNGGFQLDNNGLRLWDSSGNLNVDIDTTLAKIILGGLSKIVLDSLTGALTINDATYGNQGIQLQYNAGTPRMYVGDGANKSVEFDGTDVKLGRDSKLLGTDAYNNDNFYLHETFPSLDSWPSTLTGTSSAQLDSVSVVLEVDGTAAAEAIIDKNPGYAIQSLTWVNNRRYKIAVFFWGDHTSAVSYILWGSEVSSRNHIGFKLTDRVIEGLNGNATTQTVTNLATTASSSSQVLLEFIFTAGTSVEFFVDGVSKGTSTTNLPTSDTSYANRLRIRHTKTSSGSAEKSRMYFSELKLLQD